MIKKIAAAFCTVAAISLLVSSIAHADSWVLWDKKAHVAPSLKEDITWEIVDAYPEHKQCWTVLKKFWQIEKDSAIESKKKDSNITEVNEVPYSEVTKVIVNSSNITVISKKFFCLPGTLDPRDRK